MIAPAMFGNVARPRSRIVLCVALAVVVALGLGSRRFGAVLPGFLAANAGDALWTMAVYLAVAIGAPKWAPLRLGLIAFAASVIVEASQLLDVGWLNAIRKTLPGRLLLGAGFVWSDLLRYFIGAMGSMTLDWLWAALAKAMRGRSRGVW